MIKHPILSALTVASIVSSTPVQPGRAAEPGGKPAVSPELAAFEKTLNGFGAEVKTIMEPSPGKGIDFAPLVEVMIRIQKIKADGLPDDLKTAFGEFCAITGRRVEVIRGLPAGVEMSKLKAWAEANAKTDPEAVKRIQGFPEAMKKLDAEGDAAETRLFEIAAGHGINLRPFRDPGSIGRESLTAAKGATTPDEFAAAIRAFSAKRAELGEKAKVAGTLGGLAASTRAQAQLLFAIPTEGLPAGILGPFVNYREATEKLGWALSDYPPDMPAEREAIDAYIKKKSAENAGFGSLVAGLSQRQKQCGLALADAAAKFKQAAEAAGLSLSAAKK